MGTLMGNLRDRRCHVRIRGKAGLSGTSPWTQSLLGGSPDSHRVLKARGGGRGKGEQGGHTYLHWRWGQALAGYSMQEGSRPSRPGLTRAPWPARAWGQEAWASNC